MPGIQNFDALLALSVVGVLFLTAWRMHRASERDAQRSRPTYEQLPRYAPVRR